MNGSYFRPIALLLVAVILFGMSVSGGATIGGAQSTTTGTPDNGTIEDSFWNNSSASHANPEVVNEPGDLASVSDWLSDRMSSRLDSSTVQISQSEYDQARDLVGDEYDELLASYVEVAGETDSQSDDSAGDAYRSAKEAQSDLANSTEQFEENESAYTEAVQRGDVDEARKYARNMSVLSDQVSESGSQLSNANKDLAQSLGVEDPINVEPVNETVFRVTNRTEQATAATFQNTSLKISHFDTVGSPVDPIRVVGYLENTSGDPIKNRNVTIAVSENEETVNLNRSGGFELSYRPITHNSGLQQINVSYLPKATAAYLGSEQAIAVDVRTVNASITANASPTNGSFGDSIQLTGLVKASNTSLGTVPVEASLGAEVETDVTNQTGEFSLILPISAQLASGDSAANILLESENISIKAEPESVPIQINPISTSISVAGTSNTSDPTMYGTLQTERGDPIPDQRITIRINTSETVTTQTNSSGSYVAQIPPNEEFANATVTVETIFQGENTHLESARASTKVELGSGVGQNTSPNWLAYAGVLLALIGMGGLILYWYARNRIWSATTASDQRGAESPGEMAEGGAPDPQDKINSQPLVDVQGAENKRMAIQHSFSDLRRNLAVRYAVENATNLTHREFEREISPLIEATDAVETVSEIYDRVIYGGESPSSDTIEDFVTARDRLFEELRNPPATEAND